MQYTKVVSEIFYLKMEVKPEYNLVEKNNTIINYIHKPILTAYYLNLYKSVGEHLNWLDRLLMPADELTEKINDPKTHIYQFLIDNKSAGYCEIIEEDKYTEILYFGLVPEFVGKGYGKYFLQKTIALAWSYKPNWVQLNTCDLDHPNALPTYISQGFKHYKTIKEEKKKRKLSKQVSNKKSLLLRKQKA